MPKRSVACENQQGQHRLFVPLKTDMSFDSPRCINTELSSYSRSASPFQISSTSCLSVLILCSASMISIEISPRLLSRSAFSSSSIWVEGSQSCEGKRSSTSVARASVKGRFCERQTGQRAELGREEGAKRGTRAHPRVLQRVHPLAKVLDLGRLRPGRLPLRGVGLLAVAVHLERLGEGDEGVGLVGSARLAVELGALQQ